MVPNIFSNVPGGTGIPLVELDENFAYLTNGTAFSPTVMGYVDMTGNLNVGGNLTVTGLSTFNGGTVTNGGQLVNGGSTINGGLNLNGPLVYNGIPIALTGVTGTGLLVLNNTPTLITPILGTPTSGDLQNCTNYPVAQLAGTGANVIPFLQAPTSNNLRLAVTDETGAGSLVFNNSPTLVTPILGTPQSGDLQNCTNYPAGALAGVDPSVHNALIVPPNLAGGFVLYNGAAGNLTVDSLLMNGSTSGQTVFKAAATAGSTTITLPAASGTVLLDTTLTSVPPGAFMFFCMATPPAGWLVCDGTTYSTATYPALFAAIGYTYGGAGAVFAVPNATGAFVRGLGGNAAALGTLQAGQLGSHSHAVNDPGHTHTVTDPGHAHSINDPGHIHSIQMRNNGGAALGGGAVVEAYNPSNTYAATTGISVNGNVTGVSNNTNTTGISVQTTGGNETRPLNLAFLPCIKT